jgi:hypothetical protein
MRTLIVLGCLSLFFATSMMPMQQGGNGNNYIDNHALQTLMQNAITPALALISYTLAHHDSKSPSTKARAIRWLSVGASMVPITTLVNHIQSGHPVDGIAILPLYAFYQWTRVFRLARSAQLHAHFPSIIRAAATANVVTEVGSLVERPSSDSPQTLTTIAFASWGLSFCFAWANRIPHALAAFSVGNAAAQLDQTVASESTIVAHALGIIAAFSSFHGALVAPASLGSLAIGSAVMASRSLVRKFSSKKEG